MDAHQVAAAREHLTKTVNMAREEALVLRKRAESKDSEAGVASADHAIELTEKLAELLDDTKISRVSVEARHHRNEEARIMLRDCVRQLRETAMSLD